MDADLPLSVMCAMMPMSIPMFDRCMAAGPRLVRYDEEKSNMFCKFRNSGADSAFGFPTACCSCVSVISSAVFRRRSSTAVAENRVASCENAVNASRRVAPGSTLLQPPDVTLGSISATSRLHAVNGASWPRSSVFTNVMKSSTLFMLNSAS